MGRDMFLGVDGGGTKTAFVLIDSEGNIRAEHQEASAYYLEIGFDPLQAMLDRGTEKTLSLAGITERDLRYAFYALPAYGEDSQVTDKFDALPAAFLGQGRFECDNDMISSWAGSMACADGINIICGTGSMAYGRFQNRGARSGGWGELFSDEGSAYWIAREGLNLFSKMSDGRANRGALHELVVRQFSLRADLDLCGHVYSTLGVQRSAVAQLSQIVGEAALLGDTQCKAIFYRAAQELAGMIFAVRRQLNVPDDIIFPVSYSGGVFASGDLLLKPFQDALLSGANKFRLVQPVFSPAIGAAIYAARRSGAPLSQRALDRLKSHFKT